MAVWGIWWGFLCVSLQACFILCDCSFSWLIDVMRSRAVFLYGHMYGVVHTCCFQLSSSTTLHGFLFWGNVSHSSWSSLNGWLGWPVRSHPDLQLHSHVPMSVFVNHARDPNSGPHALYSKHLNHRVLRNPYLNLFIDIICICRACGACNPYCH